MSILFLLVSAPIKKQDVKKKNAKKLTKQEGLRGQKWTVDGSLSLCQKWSQRHRDDMPCIEAAWRSSESLRATGRHTRLRVWTAAMRRMLLKSTPVTAHTYPSKPQHPYNMSLPQTFPMKNQGHISRWALRCSEPWSGTGN